MVGVIRGVGARLFEVACLGVEGRDCEGGGAGVETADGSRRISNAGAGLDSQACNMREEGRQKFQSSESGMPRST